MSTINTGDSADRRTACSLHGVLCRIVKELGARRTSHQLAAIDKRECRSVIEAREQNGCAAGLNEAIQVIETIYEEMRHNKDSATPVA
jgi:hypothetical protein